MDLDFSSIVMNIYQNTFILKKQKKTAKINLENVELVKSSGFNASELKQIRNLVEENKEVLIQKWDEFFNN